MPKLKTASIMKYKALKLITPEYANDLGLPAEAPTFISPYITSAQRCEYCHVTYSPLVYQVGKETEAQHFCKINGGGIYVRLHDDTSGKWVYTNDLWDALVIPYGPIRMGDDRGYQFASVRLIRMMPPQCISCATPDHTGDHTGGLISVANTLKPICTTCIQAVQPYDTSAEMEWHYTYDGTEIRFKPVGAYTLDDIRQQHARAIPTYESHTSGANGWIEQEPLV